MIRRLFLAAVSVLLAAGPAVAEDQAHTLPYTGPVTLPWAETTSTELPERLNKPLFLSPPWEPNALADSLDTSPPPDGALFVTRQAGPDSSVILLGYNYQNSGWWARMSRSDDGGLTYQPFTLDTGFFVDVCLHGNGRDTCWNLSLVAVGVGVYHLFVRPSYDAGVTWGDTTRCDLGTTRFPDKPMYVTKDSLQIVTFTDFTDANRRITMARSTDYGVTWQSGDVRVSNASSQGSCPAIGPDSMVYAVWGQPASWVPSTLWFNRSFDRGATWGTPSQIPGLETSGHLSGWRANHTFPAVVVDSAGKIYVCCQTKMEDEGWDVGIWTSADAGSTWSGPVRVNDDTTAGSDQFCPWIALDRYQRPHVFWYDSRNYYPVNSGDVYYSWSDDVGTTWKPNEMVNDSIHSPCWTSASRMQMGDYQQIACDTNYVYCEWSDHRNGRTSWSYIAAARRALPTFEVGVAEEGRPSHWQQSRVFLGKSAPNPVVDGARISFSLDREARARLSVFDPAGRLVSSVLDAELEAGEHTARWGGLDDQGRRVPAGVYYYRLDAGENSTATRRLVKAR
ncbi:MAG: T9SS type A sorting domain-containing protein [candidate division WOR-3 bacterium]|nr:MAG: T9SS type A sorting domain-containing protein [candidate division WOR-3 bacterium]